MEGTNKLIYAFITLIIGIVFVVIIAGNSIAVTEKDVVINESDNLATSCMTFDATYGWVIDESSTNCNITVSKNPSGWKSTDCPLTNVIVSNVTATGTFAAATDYILHASIGIIQMQNTTDTQDGQANSTLTDYTYCSDGYMNLSWGRSLLNLVGGFIAIALLLVSVGLFYGIAKDNNIV